MIYAELGFEGLCLLCVIGAFDSERLSKQEIVMDVKVFCDVDKAVETDDYRHTVDYVKLVEIATLHASQGAYHLLETLASRIAEEVLSTFDVVKVYVKIRKPQAIAGPARAIVEMTRWQKPS